MSTQNINVVEKYDDIDDIDLAINLLNASIGNTATDDTTFNTTNSDDSKKKRKNDEIIRDMAKQIPLTADISCGFWFIRGKFFQRFANQTSYVVLYGLVGCFFAMTYAYFNGTITTIEKRFRIPSRNTGIISVGSNISQTLVSAIISYYAGKSHRPRWIGFGVLTVVLFCLLSASPQLFYGPGDDALALTNEFGATSNISMDVVEREHSKGLCKLDISNDQCQVGEGTFAPQVILFVAQSISGIGGSLYYTLGIAYMDDNTKKSKIPTMLSLSFFLHMLGPAIGYALASFCLRLYIVPYLQPIINDKDPRWLGAWWLGWLIMGIILLVCTILLAMFPKELPVTVVRRTLREEEERKLNTIEEHDEENMDGVKQASFGDMLTTFKRLLKNKTLTYNNISSVFYFFGFAPYWIFTPKYIEIIYKQSAATSSMVTGTVALAFTAIGTLLSGFVISKYKPRARYLAGWNVISGFLTVLGMLSYAIIDCPGNEQSIIVNIPDSFLNSTATCNSHCHCDYVPYSPVCGENNMTYISACHAGCKQQHVDAKGLKIFEDCTCITNGDRVSNLSDIITTSFTYSNVIINNTVGDIVGGQAKAGACPVNCFTQFVTFLAVMCCLQFLGASGRSSNLLVSMRCVSEEDKNVAMGLGMMMISLLTFIPSPIFFGWLLDSFCLVWGKTCTNKGNCWLYDPESLRFSLNVIASSFVTLGVLFDCVVWYYVKDLKIFDDEIKDIEMSNMDKDRIVEATKKIEVY